MIDTHAHIYDPTFNEDLDTMLATCHSVGITEIWMPNCDSSTIAPMLALHEKYPNFCQPMLGLHPCYVKENYLDELAILEAKLLTIRPLSIGEIGLDLYWDKSFFAQQQAAFIKQCQLALQYGLWVDIHCRQAFAETMELIQEVNNPALCGIFHCFSGSVEDAHAAIDQGFLLGIGGVVTYKNSGLDKFLAQIPLQYIVLETDSPYLAPTPNRGKRNQPSFLPYIAQRLAQIYSVTEAEIVKITTKNALALKNRSISTHNF
jgi:TatD DNase family protein